MRKDLPRLPRRRTPPIRGGTTVRIVGEALNQFAKLEPRIADDIADLGRIVAFRNILIHGYATVDDTIVWQMLTAKLPALQSNLRSILDRMNGA
jgi:uncharacterized protein with HEPN domain